MKQISEVKGKTVHVVFKYLLEAALERGGRSYAESDS
jgi:hypothetical protein